MKTAIFKGKGQIAVEERPKPTITEPTDAIVRVVLACVCGSDLWFYRGVSDLPTGRSDTSSSASSTRSATTSATLAVGDFVISPFTWSDGTCKNCQAGFHSACVHGGVFGRAARVMAARPSSSVFRRPTAPSSRSRLDFSDETMASFLALTDVMAPATTPR